MRYAWLGLLAGMAALAGCNMDRTAEVPRLTGTVEFHDAGVAIGGETDPHGFILTGDHSAVLRRHVDPRRIELTPDQVERGYPGTIHWGRLYLRRADSLRHPMIAERQGQRVTVEGPVELIHAGGVETPPRSFPVMDVREVRPGGN